MLKKLLKYDLAWCFKPLLVFYIITFFFAVAVRIVESFEMSLMVVIIDKICCAILIAMIVCILINCFMRNWARFVKNIYKDESYLTHTLPVSKNQIFLSKVLTAVITLFTSFTVIVICLAVAVLNEEYWIVLKESLEQTAVYFDSPVSNFIFLVIITIFFEFLFMMMSGILGIIIGHKSNNLKIIKSIITGFLIYTIMSLLSLGVLFVIGLQNADIMALFDRLEVSSSALKGMMFIGMSVYAVYNVVIYIAGNKVFAKGVDID